jgi:hypothetical protein
MSAEKSARHEVWMKPMRPSELIHGDYRLMKAGFAAA